VRVPLIRDSNRSVEIFTLRFVMNCVKVRHSHVMLFAPVVTHDKVFDGVGEGNSSTLFSEAG